MSNKPECLNLKTVARSRLFTIEEMDLRFTNGEHRVFERVRSGTKAAVLIVPLLDPQTFLLAREYAAGVDRYELGFPKGVCEPGESVLEGANRELMEELGYGAKQLHLLKSLTILPGYFNASSHLVLATELYEKKLPGDEPEAIDLVPWKLEDFDELLACENFSDARSIAAIYMVRDIILQEGRR